MAELSEPSGVVYHPARKTLFAVGDEGDVAEVDLSGRVINVKRIRGDLEAITCNPATGNLFVVREGHEIIFELRPSDFKILRRFDIDRTYQGDPNFLQRGGDGIEGIAFIPDPDHREGGRFFAVNQYDPPVLLELHLPLKTSEERFEKATIVKVKELSKPPLSGLSWSGELNRLLVVSALWRSVYVVDLDGKQYETTRIPGFMQEGIASVPGGMFVIAQDTGGLVKWKPARNPFSAAGR